MGKTQFIKKIAEETYQEFSAYEDGNGYVVYRILDKIIKVDLWDANGRQSLRINNFWDGVHGALFLWVYNHWIVIE